MKVLDLPLKREYYLMIESGIKREEYREIKPFWISRLLVGGYSESGEIAFKNFPLVRFRFGYTKRTMLFEVEGLRVGQGNPDWGAPVGKDVFILKIGKRVQQPQFLPR